MHIFLCVWKMQQKTFSKLKLLFWRDKTYELSVELILFCQTVHKNIQHFIFVVLWGSSSHLLQIYRFIYTLLFIYSLLFGNIIYNLQRVVEAMEKCFYYKNPPVEKLKEASGEAQTIVSLIKMPDLWEEGLF